MTAMTEDQPTRAPLTRYQKTVITLVAALIAAVIAAVIIFLVVSHTAAVEAAKDECNANYAAGSYGWFACMSRAE